MQVLRGCFNGTGAALYVCLGFKPDYFRLVNLTASTNPLILEWSRSMQKEVLAYGGIEYNGSGVPIKNTTAGIYTYDGGDLMTSSNQTVVYGTGIYLERDHANYQADYVYGSGTKGTPFNKWTFDGTLSGHFNVAEVSSGARVGIGSRICIKEDSSGLVKEAYITAVTSGFSTASQVTLSRVIGTGTITFIGGLYDMIPLALGKVTSPGVKIADTTVNVDDNFLYFEAFADK